MIIITVGGAPGRRNNAGPDDVAPAAYAHGVIGIRRRARALANSTRVRGPVVTRSRRRRVMTTVFRGGPTSRNVVAWFRSGPRRKPCRVDDAVGPASPVTAAARLVTVDAGRSTTVVWTARVSRATGWSSVLLSTSLGTAGTSASVVARRRAAVSLRRSRRGRRARESAEREQWSAWKNKNPEKTAVIATKKVPDDVHERENIYRGYCPRTLFMNSRQKTRFDREGVCRQARIKNIFGPGPNIIWGGGVHFE